VQKNIGLADALDQSVALLLVGKIAGDRLLAAIERDEAQRVAFEERRPPFARVVALGALDLHHVRPHRRQDLAGEWSREVLRDLDDLDAFERQRHRGSLSANAL